MTTPPLWLQPSLTVTSILVAIFRDEIVIGKNAVKSGIKKARVRQLNRRLQIIGYLHEKPENLAGYFMKAIVLVAVLLTLDLLQIWAGSAPEQQPIEHRILNIILSDFTYFMVTVAAHNASYVHEYAEFRKRTEAKILELGGTVDVPEKPKRKRKSAVPRGESGGASS
jgi:hypothetical protein